MKFFFLKKRALIFAFVCIFLLLGSFSFYRRYIYTSDLLVVGPIKFNDGIGRQTIGLIDCLYKSCSIKYFKKGTFDTKDLPESINKMVQTKWGGTSHVLIFENPLLFPNQKKFKSLPASTVKIAYSMVESTKIPKKWVEILNEQFDAVAVPDSFLVSVYQNSGVEVPIFVLPLGMYLDPFLEKFQNRSKNESRPFVFGNLGSFIQRKNQDTLIKAFARAFANNPNVLLILNGRYGDKEYRANIHNLINSLRITNVQISKRCLDWKEYIDQINSFDCYVSPSKGEGFSLSPRESLALGIPTIVTDNTAQSTICNAGFVKTVSSKIQVPAEYKLFQKWNEDLGLQFDCDEEELAQALKEVYENYDNYTLKAVSSKNWIEQYKYENLKELYKTLVLPQKIVISDINKIEPGVIYTTSEDLKMKYEKIILSQNLFRKKLNDVVIYLQ